MQEFLTWIFVQTVYDFHFTVENLFSICIYYIMIYDIPYTPTIFIMQETH